MSIRYRRQETTTITITATTNANASIIQWCITTDDCRPTTAFENIHYQ
jgi:hypothetical protein